MTKMLLLTEKLLFVIHSLLLLAMWGFLGLVSMRNNQSKQKKKGEAAVHGYNPALF